MNLENILVGLDTKHNLDDFILFKWYCDHIHKVNFSFLISFMFFFLSSLAKTNVICIDLLRRNALSLKLWCWQNTHATSAQHRGRCAQLRQLMQLGNL
jgi:hypothetical protein